MSLLCSIGRWKRSCKALSFEDEHDTPHTTFSNLMFPLEMLSGCTSITDRSYLWMIAGRQVSCHAWFHACLATKKNSQLLIEGRASWRAGTASGRPRDGAVDVTNYGTWLWAHVNQTSRAGGMFAYPFLGMVDIDPFGTVLLGTHQVGSQVHHRPGWFRSCQEPRETGTVMLSDDQWYAVNS